MPYHHHYDVQCSLIFFKTVYVYVVHNEAYRSVFFCSSILHILIWHVKLLICLCVRITNQQLHTIITFIWQYVLIWDSLNLYSRNHSSENANDTTESTLSATIHDQQHRPKVIHERFLFGFCCCSPSHECIAYRHRITVVEWHFTLFKFACRNKQRSKKKKKCFFFRVAWPHNPIRKLFARWQYWIQALMLSLHDGEHTQHSHTAMFNWPQLTWLVERLIEFAALFFEPLIARSSSVLVLCRSLFCCAAHWHLACAGLCALCAYCHCGSVGCRTTGCWLLKRIPVGGTIFEYMAANMHICR